MEIVKSIIREQLIKEKKMCSRTHLIDTTVMEKHIEYLTESFLLYNGRTKLMKTIHKLKSCGMK